MNTIKHIFYVSLLMISYSAYSMDSSSSSEDVAFPTYNYLANIDALKKKHREELQQLNLQLLFEIHYASDKESKNKLTLDAPQLITQLTKQQKKEIKQLKRKPILKSSK